MTSLIGGGSVGLKIYRSEPIAFVTGAIEVVHNLDLSYIIKVQLIRVGSNDGNVAEDYFNYQNGPSDGYNVGTAVGWNVTDSNRLTLYTYENVGSFRVKVFGV